MQPPEPAHCHGASSSSSGAPRRRSVGCMAGLLRLLSPYHRSHHRKRLTAKNAAPPVVCTAPSPPPPFRQKVPVATYSPSSQGQPTQQQMHPAPTPVRRRRSCDAPRSPTIAPEHRRASCDSPRPTPPAIVARLMGLEESAPPSPAASTPRPLPTRPPPPPPETAAEKRRKLLGALEKCDEDLKTLRRIIAAVRAAEMRAAAASDAPPTPEATGKGSDNRWKDDGRDVDPSPSPTPQKPRSEEHYPSPDSVLDAITSPRFPCRKRSSPCTDLDADRKLSCGTPAVGSKIVKPSRTLVFSGDYCKIKPCNELHAVAMYHHPVVAIEAIPRWMPPPPPPSSEISWRHRRRWGLEAAAASERSRAMAESVGEVWGHGADEERHEAGRVGAALERAILHDLVGDVVAEMLAQSAAPPQHPFVHGDGGAAAMCRKKLVF
uniref:DUF3741 domain-containing protein n=1 Tax=Oryza meridionalis TaxID=40149 RepID=A0A0E0CZS0_9ORYZ